MRDDDRLDLLVQLGDLLFGGVGGKDVDELVLSICHCCSFRTLASLAAARERRSGHQIRWQGVRAAARYSVVAGSPPLNSFITASIPDVMNISAASAARVVMRSTSAASSLSNRDEHVIGQIPPLVAASDAEPQPRELVARGAR